LGLGALGCTPGGVGDPCTPEDEYQQTFNGFQVTETNVESRSFQCETRLCLVNHFQGRVSCRLGQSADVAQPFTDAPNPHPAGEARNTTTWNAGWKPVCSIPGTAVDRNDPDTLAADAQGNGIGRISPNNINVEVKPQLAQRQTDKAVYCSCRCDGPDKNARYCECPDGFECTHLVDSLQITTGSGQLAGSYCIRAGSKYDPNASLVDTCADNAKSCGCDPAAKNYPEECGAHP
jgi:hypothetical protein